MTPGDDVYDDTGGTEAGRCYRVSFCISIKSFKRDATLYSPQRVDSDLMRFFGRCCEHSKQLHQHRWKEVDDDMSLHGMQAL